MPEYFGKVSSGFEYPGAGWLRLPPWRLALMAAAVIALPEIVTVYAVLILHTRFLDLTGSITSEGRGVIAS